MGKWMEIESLVFCLILTDQTHNRVPILKSESRALLKHTNSWKIFIQETDEFFIDLLYWIPPQACLFLAPKLHETGTLWIDGVNFI